MSEPTKQEVIALYKPPFRFECGYIWDAEGKMVADDPCQDDATMRIRGWGRIRYLGNPHKLQDAVGQHIADILTKHWGPTP